ncbi:polymorphic toxin-type HINT domain-containing protein, partial [Streptomyces sp. CC208A]|uniref:polymorphic toxin-type HINT domain-containing protein n=1 Tax=Streptomyces sp. CC208A TaxID=3044573 RepID=UPI0024A7BBB5
TKPIEKVKTGDKVVATAPESGETRIETVTAEIKGQGLKHLVKITIDTDGKAGAKTAQVTATDGHPFWVPEVGTWIDATDLKSGQWLRTSAGTYVQIASIERWTAQDATVHNLTVSDLHTYYVQMADVPVLVHNCGPGGQDRADPGHAYEGGVYKELKGADGRNVPGTEINHVPPASVAEMHFGYTTGPAIQMDYLDHRAVYSTGSSRAAKAWRMWQAELIGSGRIDEAIQMDINDIRSRFGSKYDGAIGQMVAGLAGNPVYQRLRTVPSRIG